MSQTVFFAGLPRSGSTLLVNLLGQHKDIAATPSSPLCSIIQNMIRNWSDDIFLLSQLDSNFNNVYKKLEDSTKAFIDAWNNVPDKSITINKNRGWLFLLETLRTLYPDFKIIVSLRDLRDVYASIEKQHRKTRLLDFPDHMEQNLVDVRANSLFSDNGVIGSPVKALYNIGDIPNIVNHIYFVRFEDLMVRPQEVMNNLFNWLKVSPQDINFQDIKTVTKEADSYYRYKYRHVVHSKLTPPPSFSESEISPRIIDTIINRFEWFYHQYYPEFATPVRTEPPVAITKIDVVTEQITEDITKAIEEETGLDTI